MCFERRCKLHHNGPSNYKLGLLLDFDGTVTENDIGNLIVSRFAIPGWESAYESFQRGEILARELWESQIGHLVQERELYSVNYALQEAQIRPGLNELVQFCESYDIPVEIVSSGLGYYVEALLLHFGLGNRLSVVCPTLTYDSYGHGVINVGIDFKECGYTALCKCDRAWRLRRQGREAIFVGDGLSDYCVSFQADHLLATGDLAKYCDSHRRPYTPFVDFQDVLAYVQRLVVS